MVELTIETLIKIIIGVVVFVAVVLGVYLSMKTYIIPYFTGFGFNDTGQSNFGGGEELCRGKNTLGIIQDNYFIWGSDKPRATKIYFEANGYLRYNDARILSDSKIGKVNGYTIEIFGTYLTKENILKYDPASRLNGAYIGGKEVCK